MYGFLCIYFVWNSLSFLILWIYGCLPIWGNFQLFLQIFFSTPSSLFFPYWTFIRPFFVPQEWSLLVNLTISPSYLKPSSGFSLQIECSPDSSPCCLRPHNLPVTISLTSFPTSFHFIHCFYHSGFFLSLEHASHLCLCTWGFFYLECSFPDLCMVVSFGYLHKLPPQRGFLWLPQLKAVPSPQSTHTCTLLTHISLNSFMEI